jgi:Family of unknown function (DUF6491)
MRSFLSLAALALLATACASTGISGSGRVELYRAHAGDPVGNFKNWNRSLQWRALSNDALVVWARPSEAFLLEFRNSCPGLISAREITISNSGQLVAAGFDSVRITSPLANRTACRITTIRPLDLPAISDAKREQREARDAQYVEREPGVTAEQP